jgi:hypothetical protein
MGIGSVSLVAQEIRKIRARTQVQNLDMVIGSVGLLEDSCRVGNEYFCDLTRSTKYLMAEFGIQLETALVLIVSVGKLQPQKRCFSDRVNNGHLAPGKGQCSDRKLHFLSFAVYVNEPEGFRCSEKLSLLEDGRIKGKLTILYRNP